MKRMDVAQRTPGRVWDLEALSSADLVVIGYMVVVGEGPSVSEVPASVLADALVRVGFTGSRRALVAKIFEAARDAGFDVRDACLKPANPGATLRRAARLLSFGAGAGSKVGPTPTPPPTLRVQERERPSPRVQERERPSPRAPRPRGDGATPAVPEPVLSRAVPIVTPPVSLTAFDTERLARIFNGPSSDAARVSLALRAHALSAAADFQDLVSLATLRGVDSHAYQTETVRRVLRILRGRALLADEVGLGKTIEAMMVLREYQLRGMARRALILAPPALVRHWAGELEAKAGIVARTTEDARLREEPDAFWRDDGVVVASLALARGGRHAPAVQAAPWDIVVVDEAHHVKNRQTAGWKLVDGIQSRFLLLLTATPVETDLEEIYNLVTLLKPGQLTTPAEFRRQFVDAKDATVPRDTERLRRLLADVMVRNTRAQSGLALPPRYVSTVAIDPSDAERAVYDATVPLLRAHAADPKARLATSTLLLEAGSSPAALQGTLVRMGATDHHSAAMREGTARLTRMLADVNGSGKLDALLQIIGAHEGRVLVFTRFRDTLDYIAGGLRAAGVDPELFHGGMRSEDRHSALCRFRAGAKVLLATDVGGEGQNLQFCQTLVNFDLPWNPMRIEQRIGRLHRMGQTGEVRVFNLCARGTVEDRVLDVLDRRLHLFELVVGEMDMVLGNLGDERDLEERILELYATAQGDDDVARGFDRLADEIRTARHQYERVRAVDEALFRSDFEA
jgi:superfamily II DNA or RNA helicase